MTLTQAGSLPFVSVIVPVFNGERTIGKCLHALLALNYPTNCREIVVVDNGSTDRTAEIVKSLPVRYVREEIRGPSMARNRGIATATGNLLAFTDADCYVTSAWLRELVAGFADDAVGVVAGEVVAYPPRTATERYLATRRPLWQSQSFHYPSCPWIGTGNVGFRRAVFDSVGLFDPAFTGVGCEDVDLAWRVFRSGQFKVAYRPRALVFHHHRATPQGLFGQYGRYGRGQAILSRKHPDTISWGWQRELAAYWDLTLTTLVLGRVAVTVVLGRRPGTALSYAYLDLVRKLGERIGFIRGIWETARISTVWGRR